MKLPGRHPPMLSFKIVEKVYRSEHRICRALGPISFTVDPGEFVAVMGPSGSGKTTLLRLAGTLDSPSEGEVILDGDSLRCRSPAALASLRRQKLGFVFQQYNLLPGLTAIENVSLPLELQGYPLPECRRQASQELEDVGLGSHLDRFPDELSGGEQQRVAIARALVGPRSLLLADEPTGALDSTTAESIMRLLREQCERGRTIILVTHDALHAAWADRILYLRDGILVDEVQPLASAKRRCTTPGGL